MKILPPHAYLFRKKRDLTWFGVGPKFNLQQLRKISTGFKMAVLTLKWGIYTISVVPAVKQRFKHSSQTI